MGFLVPDFTFSCHPLHTFLLLRWLHEPQSPRFMPSPPHFSSFSMASRAPVAAFRAILSTLFFFFDGFTSPSLRVLCHPLHTFLHLRWIPKSFIITRNNRNNQNNRNNRNNRNNQNHHPSNLYTLFNIKNEISLPNRKYLNYTRAPSGAR